MPISRYLISLALTLVSLVVCGQPVLAADNLQKATLRGLTAVGVMVENLSPELEKDGVTTADLQRDVELRLRTAGIRVASEAQFLELPGMPYLLINVDSNKQSDRSYCFSILVSLRQFVILERNKDILAVATTWSTGVGIGFVGAKVIRGIREYVRDAADMFINDYLAVNPK